MKYLMKEEENQTWKEVVPTTLSPELQSRFLAAMQQAASEESECTRIEQELRHFTPAPLPEARKETLLGRMYRESSLAGMSRQGWERWLFRWSSVAAALFLLAGAFCLLMEDSGIFLSSQGLASRSVIDTRGGSVLQWENEHTPVLHYDVVYEDSLVLESVDHTTIVVRVPNRESVRVPAEMI